ncbi:phosphomannomutase [Colwellia sp. E2M01]|uniref:phosphomannomutase n=1 Tax=Colwellia sp. E2M01 TaxID=2841561 RepID=UPI001C07F4BC|nr:phosphomannomutase [Colwellia sp. E2M01]MBU2870424.1 phosphomannomutase [Colwellia sp. E2M01]
MNTTNDNVININPKSLTCFKTYDIRGIVPTELNNEIAYRIGRAYASRFTPNTVVIGNDIRLSGPELSAALAQGLRDSGVNVINIGECGTEEIYFAVPHLNADGGICVTASHNPANYNGMKFVGKGSTPISADNGLFDIKSLAEKNKFTAITDIGTLEKSDISSAYINKLMTFTNTDNLKPLKIVANPGNGGAGAVINGIEPHLPYNFKKVQFTPDGHFPNGVPNPLLPENRAVSRDAVLAEKADFGIAWDGDFDRCFFFDERGEFIEGYYIVGLLAQVMLAKQPNEKIVYDPRLYWSTLETIASANGTAIASKTGHAFIKQTMRSEDALYGGEMSAHHYFRDFYYCDNGNIPWLLIAELISTSGKTLSQLVKSVTEKFPCSGEINLTVNDSNKIIAALTDTYTEDALNIETIDGIGMNFLNWRFNVRTSNTEPLLRVNIETRGDKKLLTEKTTELIDLINKLNTK